MKRLITQITNKLEVINMKHKQELEVNVIIT